MLSFGPGAEGFGGVSLASLWQSRKVFENWRGERFEAFGRRGSELRRWAFEWGEGLGESRRGRQGRCSATGGCWGRLAGGGWETGLAEDGGGPGPNGDWSVHGLGVRVVVEPVDCAEEEGGELGLAGGDE